MGWFIAAIFAAVMLGFTLAPLFLDGKDDR